MTWTQTSSPTLRAAAAPASVAAFTEPTSPRTIAVTSPASTFCQPTNTTFAVLTIGVPLPRRHRPMTDQAGDDLIVGGHETGIPLKGANSTCQRQQVGDLDRF